MLFRTLHTITCLLVYRLSVVVLHADDIEALGASALFAVHPIHTEAVTGIVGRADILCCLLCISALLMFIRACSERGSTSWIPFVCCLVTVTLASLAKEIGVTVVAVMLVYDLLFSSEVFPPLKSIFRWIFSRSKTKERIPCYYFEIGRASCRERV